MNALEILTACSTNGIHLWTEGDRLRFRAPKDALSAELREQIRRCKLELIDLLQRRGSEVKMTFPLSYGQRALWFMQQMTPDSSAYNSTLVFRIRSCVELAAMRRSLQALVDRHPILRTRYRVQHGAPVQDVFAFERVQFTCTDVSDLSAAALHETVLKLHGQPFDLERGPIMRVDLLTQAERSHIFLMTMHHIACDGWSGWILMEELGQLYAAEVDNRSITLPLPEKAFSDFAQEEQEMLRGPNADALAAFWQHQLRGEIPVMDLPFDRPRPKVQKLSGASHSFKLDMRLALQLKELAKTEGVTLFMLLLSAFFILLHKYSRQEDIMVGSPTFGRNKSDYSRTVGCFINQVPIRAYPKAEIDFRTFLAQVRKTSLEVLAHQDYPFHLMAERFWHNPDHGVPPLCQVEFILQKPQQSKNLLSLLSSNAGGTVDFGGLTVEYYPVSQQEGQLDLTLEMIESDGVLLGNFKYSDDLFDAATIQRIVVHFQQLLSAIVKRPEEKIGALAIMTEAEQRKILVEWNGTSQDFAGAIGVHHRFEAKAKQSPDDIAVRWDDRQLTYGELNRRANRLAQHLTAIGVGPDAIVGLCLERSFELIAALLAVLKTGAAYLPLDPAYPAERLSFMIGDARVRTMLTTTVLAPHLPVKVAQTVYMDADRRIIDACSSDNLAIPESANGLAYVIYTSGSTGTPKGVMISQRALGNFVHAAARAYGIEASDKVLQFASINFDASVEEIYPTLTQGATLALRTDDQIDSMALFLTRCQTWGITVLDLPTAFWHELTLALAHDALSLPDSVRVVIIGGETAQPQSLALWQRCVPPHIRLVNTYGPTEATVVATACDLGEQATATPPSATVPIGRPLANVQTYILDAQMQPVPVGVVGELHIGGAGLADGYLYRPDLTAQRFVPHPFSSSAQARLYKTGDLARYLPDGQIEYRGRVDTQVKVRGFRVEPGEIEAVLLKHPEVQSAHVMIHPSGQSPNVLIAYVVTSERLGSALEPLHEHLAQQLPDYMRPAVLVPVERLPRTSGGKIDSRALPSPETALPYGDEKYVAPRTPIEAKMVDIWSEVLQTKTIGVTQDFFRLGGHSLLLLKVNAHIKKHWGLELPFRQFFETPTIAKLAKTIEAFVYLAQNSQMAPIDGGAREEIEI
jgi:amino acid adenylation domain-containing protein